MGWIKNDEERRIVQTAHMHASTADPDGPGGLDEASDQVCGLLVP
jgi:hypothetical protein